MDRVRIVTPSSPAELRHEAKASGRAFSVFLSGPCDSKWRDQVVASIREHAEAVPVYVVDPTNPAWDATWKTDGSDHRYRQQIDFEISALRHSDVLVCVITEAACLTTTFELMQTGRNLNGTFLVLDPKHPRAEYIRAFAANRQIDVYKSVEEMLQGLRSVFSAGSV